MKSLPLVFLIGPTAVGKSETGLCLAEAWKVEIIGCDAMQVYREISVANDRPGQDALARVKHHLVGTVSVREEFNAARFRQLALEAVQKIQAQGQTALIIGGTGLYMSVLLDGIFEGPASDEDLREALNREMADQGLEAMHERLQKLDPQAAAKIHPHDPQRIIRALEVALVTGQPISAMQEKREGLWGRMPVKIYALNRPRAELYQRAEARVEAMFTRGLVDEIQKVLELPLSLTARKIIGIPEVSGYLKGAYDLERAKYLMKLNTRHYIKRQMTWFRKDKRIEWIDMALGQSPAHIAEIIRGRLK